MTLKTSVQRNARQIYELCALMSNFDFPIKIGRFYIRPQVAQARNMSIGEHRYCCVKFENKDLHGKKPIVSVTYENERISIKNSLPYLKCVLRLSRVVHGPIYGRFMGFLLNGFLSI